MNNFWNRFTKHILTSLKPGLITKIQTFLYG